LEAVALPRVPSRVKQGVDQKSVRPLWSHSAENEKDPDRFRAFMEYVEILVDETPHVPKPKGFDQFLEYVWSLVDSGDPAPVGDELLKEVKR